jgi:hypothetical protein
MIYGSLEPSRLASLGGCTSEESLHVSRKPANEGSQKTEEKRCCDYIKEKVWGKPLISPLSVSAGFHTKGKTRLLASNNSYHPLTRVRNSSPPTRLAARSLAVLEQLIAISCVNNSKVHYRQHNNPPLGKILSQLNPHLYISILGW